MPVFKFSKSLALFSGVCLFAFAQTAAAKEYVIGLSPNLPQAETRVTETAKFFISEMNPGDEAVFYNAYNNVSIGRFEIPEGDMYRHDRAKFTYNKRAIKALRDFAKTPDETLAPGEIKPAHFLRTVAAHHSGSEADILIIGNPLFQAQAEYSMQNGRVPGDGHLRHSAQNTPYGIDNRTGLQNMRLHMATVPPMAEVNNHAWHVKRFWTLFVEAQGGGTVTFSPDTNTVLARLKIPAAVPTHNYTLQPGNKLEMLQLLPPQVTEQNTDPADLFAEDVRQTPAPSNDLAAARNVQIGIRWPSCPGCDLDLYVRAHQGATALSYQNTNTPEGVYRKDFRSAPQGGLETVDLRGMFDAGAVALAINYYGGDSGGKAVTGEIRAKINGHVYAHPFTIDASVGNQGADADHAFGGGSVPSKHWVRLMLSDIAGR